MLLVFVDLEFDASFSALDAEGIMVDYKESH